jgi:hypothetical protein
MANWTKIIIGTGIGAGVIGVIAYASKLKRTSAELESVATANVHSVKLDGLTIRIDVKLKNPTEGSLKIKFPFVKVLFQNKVIGTSKVVNKDIMIPSHGEANITGIMVNIPPTGLLSLGGGLIGMLIKKQPAQIGVTTVTTIDLGWKTFPYSKTDSSMLKPPAPATNKPATNTKPNSKKKTGKVKKPTPVKT